MGYLALYLEFYKIKLQDVVEYRKMFIWTTFAKFSNYIAEFVIIWILIQAFHTIGTWSAYEIMFLYALNRGAYAIAGAFLYHVCTYLPDLIQSGMFDEVLTKPLNSLIFVSARSFSIGYFGTFSASLFIIILCMVKLGIQITFVKISLVLFTFVSGAMIMGGIWLICTVPSFWMVRSDALVNIFFRSFQDFSRYPLTIFNKGIRILLTLILPFAFINYYPSQFFLEKSEFLMFHPIFQFLSPLVGIVLMTMAGLFWKFGLRRYSGAGS